MIRTVQTATTALLVLVSANTANAQSARQMMCEGHSARITRTFAETSRSSADHLHAATGSRQRPCDLHGRAVREYYSRRPTPLSSGSDAAQVVTDNSNMPQTMRITFEREGSFHGETGDLPVNSQAGALACGLMAQEFCGMMSMTAQTQLSSVC